MTVNKSFTLKDIAIIVPSKNEYLNLIKLIPLLTRFSIDIIIINDNSSDDTLFFLKKFKKIKIINNKNSKGYDYSITKGLSFAKKYYKYCITMDADLEHNPKYIPNFIKNLSKYDLIIGNRDRKNRFFEKIFGLIFKQLYQIDDVYCGYRALNLKKLKISFLKKNYDLPSLIVRFHLHTQKTMCINIRTKKRADNSKFGNFFFGNLKILAQSFKLFFLKYS